MSRRQKKTSLEFAKAGGSRVAVSARFQTGAGKHGGTARAKNRRDRRLTKQDLRDIV